MERAEGGATAPGFTLVELLVTLGTVAALTAITLPVIARARESGRQGTCLANLRQLAAATQLYAQDNDGTYPRGAWGEDPGGGARRDRYWQHALTPYVKGADGVFRCPSQPRERPYRPDGRDPLQPGPPGPLRSVDYLYNGPRLNGWNPHAAGNPWEAKHESVHEIASLDPAAVWLHRDKGWVDEAGSYHLLRRVAAPSCGRPFTGGTLHSGGSNYSFVDGQVRWLTPEQMAEVECRNPPLPPPFTQAYE